MSSKASAKDPDTRKKKKKKKTAEIADPFEQCSKCMPAICCSYSAMEVSGPRSKDDFEDMLWHISHEGIEYFVEDGKWYIRYLGRCQHLGDDNRCAIYEDRFDICRKHPVDNCEFTGPYDFDHHFRTYEDLKAYMEKRWKKMRKAQKNRRDKEATKKKKKK